jgi:ferredoxin
VSQFSTYVITEPCVGVKDATCVQVCPVDCIHTTPEEDQYYIDPSVCIACEQCALVCPVEAIFLDVDVPPHTWPRPPVHRWGMPPTHLSLFSGCHLRRAM